MSGGYVDCRREDVFLSTPTALDIVLRDLADAEEPEDSSGGDRS